MKEMPSSGSRHRTIKHHTTTCRAHADIDATFKTAILDSHHAYSSTTVSTKRQMLTAVHSHMAPT
jgi:cyclopropane fatty-acyl-phospholipid synthase-like methyltransferase